MVKLGEAKNRKLSKNNIHFAEISARNGKFHETER